MLTAVPAKAEGDVVAMLSVNEQAEPGEELLLTLEIKNNPGLAAWLFRFEWDADTFEYVTDSMRAGGIFGSGQFASNTLEAGRAVANWYATQEIREDGVLFSFKLKVKDTAKTGSSGIWVRQSPENTVNLAEREIIIQTEDAVVRIGAPEDSDTEIATERGTGITEHEETEEAIQSGSELQVTPDHDQGHDEKPQETGLATNIEQPKAEPTVDGLATESGSTVEKSETRNRTFPVWVIVAGISAVAIIVVMIVLQRKRRRK